MKAPPSGGDVDQCIRLSGVTWEQYEQLLAMRGEKARPRISYVDGDVELDIYRRLEVPEVWTWRRGRILIHVLRDGRYVAEEHSSLLPELDVAALAGYVGHANQAEAARSYRRAIRGE